MGRATTALTSTNARIRISAVRLSNVNRFPIGVSVVSAKTARRIDATKLTFIAEATPARSIEAGGVRRRARLIRDSTRLLAFITSLLNRRVTSTRSDAERCVPTCTAGAGLVDESLLFVVDGVNREELNDACSELSSMRMRTSVDRTPVKPGGTRAGRSTTTNERSPAFCRISAAATAPSTAPSVASRTRSQSSVEKITSEGVVRLAPSISARMASVPTLTGITPLP